MKTNLIGYRNLFIAFMVISLFLIIWECLVFIKNIPVYLLPSPSFVFRILLTEKAQFISAAGITLGEALGGLLIGVCLGCLIASLVLLAPSLEGGVMTLSILLKSTPMVVLAPLLTLWLGFGVLPKLIITALLTFFPVVINLISGFSSVDSSLVDLFRSWQSGSWRIFTLLRVPSAVPYLFASLRICAPLSLIGAVVAEWTGASGGLGRLMWLAYSNLNLPYLFGGIFILSAFGMAFYLCLTWLEKKVVFWVPGRQEF